MSAVTALRRGRTFFLAGTMQGSRGGSDLVDQGYRPRLRDLVLRHRPGAEVRDPGELMVHWLADEAEEIRAAHAALADAEVLVRERLAAPLRRLTGVFDRLVEMSADSDVCLAWLPAHEASMGTAAEMWAAHAAGRCVVAITPMRQNLAVLASADLVVPSLAALEAVLDHPAAGPAPALGSAGMASTASVPPTMAATGMDRVRPA